MRLSPEELHRALLGHFLRLGLPEEGARAFADVLLEAELEGLRSHGLARLPIYTAQLERGGLNPTSRMQLTAVRPGLLLLEGDGAPGPWAGLRAVEALIPTVREQGVAAVAVRGAGHVGPLSPYVRRLAQAGLVGMAFANTPPALAPGPVLGTNPIALAAPMEPEPLVVDLALSVASRGKVLERAQRGESIPEGWAVDREGRPTTDPKAALEGALLPIGGGKGLALAVLVEVLAGALAGQGLGLDLPLPWERPEARAYPGFLLIGLEVVSSDFSDLLLRLGQSLAAHGGRLPGSGRAQRRASALEEGLEVPPNLADALGIGR
ncbi:Ldh family oxidoreductase [Thermus filiformis]|uniref:Lactate dehydrogenase n=1 Tax=Thermus filiformis TaxID=276 RepID=A0A0A2WW19_THEFI|nr:Ldh family oxidoreductase [Thermus filiformis]KGQ22505.2 lactate dehydrogenase [Thermus filiformis]